MYDDNVGAILLLENILVYQRTKHIYVRHRLIWDYAEDSAVKIIFTRSEENLADSFKKNLGNVPFHFLSSR